jgi:hypothetical protein
LDTSEVLDILGFAVAVLLMLGAVAAAIYAGYRTPAWWSGLPTNRVNKAAMTRRMVTQGVVLPVIAIAFGLGVLIAVGAPRILVAGILIVAIPSVAATLIAVVLWARR